MQLPWRGAEVLNFYGVATPETWKELCYAPGLPIERRKQWKGIPLPWSPGFGRERWMRARSPASRFDERKLRPCFCACAD